jgi:hypothetical protein
MLTSQHQVVFLVAQVAAVQVQPIPMSQTMQETQAVQALQVKVLQVVAVLQIAPPQQRVVAVEAQVQQEQLQHQV